MHILETCDLVHSFSANDKVLDHVTLKVAEGSIYGFLGPNGAGKTTTLRLVLGLLKKQGGTIRIFGDDFESHRIQSLRRIGSMIESPSIYAHLTATENLKVLQKIYQCPKPRIQEVLALVGLSDTRNKRAGQFSLGMKQRLSIAIALLHGPSLLILDEPTNGLDPNGIIEIRQLLKRLNSDLGITVIVSSHLLSEIDKLVSHVGIINKGRMLFQGPIEELKQRQTPTKVTFRTNNELRTREILASNGLEAVFADGKFGVPAMPPVKIAEINRHLVEGGVDVFEISILKNDLERIFIDMVSD